MKKNEREREKRQMLIASTAIAKTNDVDEQKEKIFELTNSSSN